MSPALNHHSVYFRYIWFLNRHKLYRLVSFLIDFLVSLLWGTKKEESTVERFRSKSLSGVGFCRPADPGSGPCLESSDRMSRPRGLVSPSAQAGSRETAADTRSSVRLLLDRPCLFQLAHSLTHCTDCVNLIEDSLIIILTAAPSHAMSRSEQTLVLYIYRFSLLL